MNFSDRHIGPNQQQIDAMLQYIGVDSIDTLIKKTIPNNLIEQSASYDKPALSETEVLQKLKTIANKNQICKSYIGQGYYGTITPAAIQRNVLENPAWYTPYTPYQSEISQGRLEALANFQTLTIDLTGLPYANASLLDEATAVAEAALLCIKSDRKKRNALLVDSQLFEQSKQVLKTRCEPLHIAIDFADITPNHQLTENYSGVIIQNPNRLGAVDDFTALCHQAKQSKTTVVMACDLMALLLCKSAGEMGVDIAVGSSQRFGVPLGYGGPHAAFFSCSEAFKRLIPGRIVGLSKDKLGNPAYRLALQTREQHIRREKATSNICTAQALLAIIASFYAIYHGPKGLLQIAETIHNNCKNLASSLQNAGYQIKNTVFFDTLTIALDANTSDTIQYKARQAKLNLFCDNNCISISVDETTTIKDLKTLLACFDANYVPSTTTIIPDTLRRQSAFLTHAHFNSYHSETELMRYMRQLSDKDIALDRSMIPLGSCTMKLNATTEMIPITWPEFANIHPFAPAEQCQGYSELLQSLERDLCQLTGYHAFSLQPNAGSQGEYAGLLAIRAYHQANNDDKRNLCLIPASAHGTNPASAAMCGMRTIVIACDAEGNVDIEHLDQVIAKHSSEIAAIMLTYPSTHGIFEHQITAICDKVHQCGGQVYIDGANLNAMIGICQPGAIGGDVSHLNLHKTFCIPHGGGGPGMGPIGVAKHLAPYIPNHQYLDNNSPVGAVSAAPYGSASILPITWCYIKMMGSALKRATEIAILNSNYIATRLRPYYPILYREHNQLTAHECILDCRSFKASASVEVEDIAKRLIDYGFHAPTMSFPVAGTLMVEPTESETKDELDRFCDAMINIYKEIKKIEQGEFDIANNPLKNAPHPAEMLLQDESDLAYSRSVAAYPLPSLKKNKYWVPVARVDNVYGDKNLFCSCH